MSISNALNRAGSIADPQSQADQMRVAMSLLSAMLVAAVLPMLGPLLLRDPDSWWHIRVGQDILESGAVPTVDTYSYTFAEQPWIAKEWLAQILLAKAYAAAGWNGIVLVVTGCVALTAFCACWSLSRVLRPALAAAAALIIVVLIDPIFTARPHIFTLPLIVIWTATLFDAARERAPPPLWLLGIVWLWANLHATFTLAFVIAGFAGLDLLNRIRLSDPRLLARWIVFGILCILASLLNPYGVKAILATFTVAHGNEAVALIREWQPFDASRHKLQEFVILAGVFGLLISGIRISWPRALFCMFALHLYFSHGRFVYLFFLLAPLVLIDAVIARYPSLSVQNWLAAPRDALERFFIRYDRPALIGLAALTICAAAISIRVQTNEPPETTSAKGALAFVEQHGITGRVLNSYNLGGTLIFHGIETFIDGRTDQLFLGGFAKTDDQTSRANGKALLERQIEKYKFDWVLLTVSDPRTAFFDEMPGWRRVYSDDGTVVYTRTPS